MICWSKFDFSADTKKMFRGMEQMLQFSYPHFAEVTLLQVKIGMSISVTLLLKLENSIFT